MINARHGCIATIIVIAALVARWGHVLGVGGLASGGAAALVAVARFVASVGILSSVGLVFNVGLECTAALGRHIWSS
jgi:hypothetical protein